MNKPARIALTVGISAAAAVAAPFLLVGGFQAINQLIWQLSYVLPAWLVVFALPVLAIAGVGLAAAVLALVIVWIWRKR